MTNSRGLESINFDFFKSVIYIELKITIKSEKKDDDTITVIYFVVT